MLKNKTKLRVNWCTENLIGTDRDPRKKVRTASILSNILIWLSPNCNLNVLNILAPENHHYVVLSFMSLVSY